MEVKFRRVTIEDIEAVISLCNECFDENTDIEYALDVFKETMNDKNQIYILGEVDGVVIAHAKITVIPTIYQKMNTYSILNHICVKPEYRRHNIATKMLNECYRISKENGCVAMELWSYNFRIPAHACYRNYGFEATDAVFFSKKID